MFPVSVGVLEILVSGVTASIWFGMLVAILAGYKYRLQLWCEYQGSEHPFGDAYEFTRNRDWLVRAGPLITRMVKVMQFLPLVSTAGEALLPRQWSHVSKELESMRELSKAIAEFKEDGHDHQLDSGLTIAAEGYTLRVLKELLLEVDPPPQRLGGLQTISGTGGEILWVCPHHYELYDRGLPVIS